MKSKIKLLNNVNQLNALLRTYTDNQSSIMNNNSPTTGKRAFRALLCLIISGLFIGCNLQQEVEITLPSYESRPVLECYLRPSSPFNLLITNSAPYFEPFPSLNNEFLEGLLLDSAQVEIVHDGVVYPLENQLRFNNLTGKLFNYYNPEPVPFDTINPFELLVTLADGRTITAEARMLPVVPIDSIVIQVAEGDTLSRVLTYFTDRPNETNFYRRTFHESSLDSLPEQDFSIDDRIVEDVIVFGTGFDYSSGDTLISTIYHIEEGYYNFLESVEAAVAGNGNPFAQPSPVASALEGSANAIGVFTCLSFDRKVVVLE
jgi:hypothetical protein